MKTHGSLFRKYAILFVGLVGGALVASGAIQAYFSYSENRSMLVRIQREKALAAATVIRQFLREIENQIEWTTHAAFLSGKEGAEQRRIDFLRLLRQSPAITRISHLDAAGREQLRVSRLAMDVIGSGDDHAKSPEFTEARARALYVSPVYFRKESEPYTTVSMAGPRKSAGVTVAEVNLKFIWDSIGEIRVGQGGYAYLVDRTGLLIAHPRVDLVLRKTDFSGLGQVAGAMQGGSSVTAPDDDQAVATNFDGAQVLTAHARVERPSWTVFVESPIAEAFGPLYDSLVRTAVLAAVGLALSIAAGLMLARRITVPIRALQESAARIGAGELASRIEVRTGDEIEALAGQFNDMAGRLQASYANLERRVEERTEELSEALEQQTATSEILRVIASSPGSVQPVLQAVADNAARLCAAPHVVVFRVDGDGLRAAAGHGTLMTRQIEDAYTLPIDRGSISGTAVLEKRAVQIDDFAAAAGDYPEAPGHKYPEMLDTRSMISTPLMREGEAIGTITVALSEVRPFTDKQRDLLESFADQAVIAIENARLLDELNARMHDLSESLERQTATSEVLRAIASAPGEAESVLDTIARTAQRLLMASGASIIRIEGAIAQRVAAAGLAGQVPGILSRPLDRNSPSGRAALDKHTIHIEDISRQASEYPDSPSVRGLTPVRSILTTPLIREGEGLGAITVVRSEVRPFTAEEIELLESFADQAVIAIENARLLDELQVRTDELADTVGELRALGSVGQAVSASLELQTVLDAIARHAAELAGGDASTIYAFDDETETFELQAAHRMSDAVVERITRTPIHLGEGAVGVAAQRNEPVQYADVAEADEFDMRDVSLDAGIRALLAVPLLREGRIIGGITVTRATPGAFPARTVELLRNFATQSALAIQNARLYRDIEEKSREIEIASQHKSQFLANMSHELRTPLNAILGYTELILDEIYGPAPDRMQEVLQRVEANGRHLLGLINDVLDLSKIEAGELELSISEYSMPDVVHTVFTATESLAAQKALRLSTEVPSGLPVGAGDERRIAQVLLNLVGNAIKFTDHGEVGIGVAARDDVFEVEVTDTGPGISAEEQARIFEEFHQVDSSNTKEKGGTGLGLAIAKRIVEMHGGRIWVRSTPGEGSTFGFSLPQRAEREAST